MKSLQDELQFMQKNIKPLNMNGLNGRMLVIPSKKKKNILLLYGIHASIERVYGIADLLSDYGTVTVPDWPGSGGMDSFYKIGMKPDVDTMADYLASFIKLRFRGKKVTIVGMSLGFAITTRMLQRYPELINKVDLLISVAGFSHYQDIKFSKTRTLSYRLCAKLFTYKLPAAFFRLVIINPLLIRTAYGKTHNAKSKLAHLAESEQKRAIEFEVKLWREDDTRTYMNMILEIFRMDNCKKQVDIQVEHISVDGDQYFDHSVVEQHMRIIFTDFSEHVAVIPNHAPSVVADKNEAKPLLTKSIKKLLKKKLS